MATEGMVTSNKVLYKETVWLITFI